MGHVHACIDESTHLRCCDAIDTCTLALSAAVTLVLTWAQIRTALATLISVCVANPVLPARGGRAFYGGSHTTPKVVGKSSSRRSGRSRKRRGGEVLSGTFFRCCPITMRRMLLFSTGTLMYKT